MEKITNENEVSKENIKDRLLKAMSKTMSWLTFEDLRHFLPKGQYEELLNELINKIKRDYPELSKEELQIVSEDILKRKKFEIGINDNGEFEMQEFARLLEDERIAKKMNIDEIETDKLVSVAKKTMQRHLEYNTFYDNKYLTAEEIKKMLEDNIKLAEEYQARRYEEKEIENSLEER